VALADKATERYALRLKQLTNPGVQTAAAIDTDILGYACEDVEADFEIVAGIEYDNTEARHVSVAVEGVIAKLALRSEAAGATAIALNDRYIERLEALAKVTGRDRILPVSATQLTPTAEKTGTETVRPDFDRPNFDDLIPAAPD